MLAEMINELLETAEDASERMHEITDEEAGAKPAPEKWSKKEILGHLVDSAANNHQRFVRAREVGELAIPEYHQNEWVRHQGYGERPWPELIEFWRLYNRHLGHVLGLVPEEKLGTVIRIGEKEPKTLEQVAQGYLEHMKHHLEQIISGAE